MSSRGSSLTRFGWDLVGCSVTFLHVLAVLAFAGGCSERDSPRIIIEPPPVTLGGLVVDIRGVGLEGVAVLLDGVLATSTDSDGAFSLARSQLTDGVLTFRKVGYTDLHLSIPEDVAGSDGAFDCGTKALIPVDSAAFWVLEGLEWIYESVAGPERQVLEGADPLSDGVAFSLRHFDDSPNDGLLNHWFMGRSGDVWLTGFSRSEAIGVFYSPPVLYAQAPVAAGMVWTSETSAFSLADSTLLFHGVFEFSVTSADSIDVPAGRFFAYGVARELQEETLLATGDPSLTMWALGDTSWYSPGVGRVRYVAAVDYRLTSFSLP